MRNFKLYSNGKQMASGRFVPDTKEAELRLIKLYPDFRDQCLDGFGAAITDSSGYVFAQMDEAHRQELVDAFYGPEGLNYTLARVPIDSCDFSVEPYEASPDGDLSNFDPSRTLRYILPLLEAIRAKKEIALLLSPWSPPAAFKSNGIRQQGGRCLPEHYAAWAGILCRYVKEFRDRGFRVFGITLQNEPHAVQIWDSCIWTAEEEREFMIHFVRPALDEAGFEDVGIYIWDHNKERVLDRSLTELAGEGERCAAGVAFHWYSGDHFDALREVHRLFPDKKLMLSEHCVEYRPTGPTYITRADQRREKVAHEILGDLECGMNICFDWNLLLDERGGPNYVDNFCHAPYLYDTKNAVLSRQQIYDAYWHFAHFLRPGDVRILSSSFSDKVESTAFARQSGEIILILHNRGEAAQVSVVLDKTIAALELPAGSVNTLVIGPEE